MEDITTFDSDFTEKGLALLREMGVLDDIARVYIRLVPSRLMPVFLCSPVFGGAGVSRNARRTGVGRAKKHWTGAHSRPGNVTRS